ncbi:MAG: hypothetical protein R3247_06225, partial [Rhodothermales bacterium]|nr:hypothetical protein [Rhodothermales bacterium]
MTTPFTPFPGLRPFGPGEDYLFFGREAQTDELLRRLRAHRFVAVVGASGSGKSSLVRAGLIPALQSDQALADGSHPPRGSAHWPVHIVLPSADPLMPLAASLTWDEAMAEQLQLTDSL